MDKEDRDAFNNLITATQEATNATMNLIDVIEVSKRKYHPFIWWLMETKDSMKFKNIRKYLNICWLIGCKEEFSDSGYSVCYCGKDSYYDYDSYNYGLLNVIRVSPRNIFSYIKEYIRESIRPYIRFCGDCGGIEYFFGKDFYEKHHKRCVPF